MARSTPAQLSALHAVVPVRGLRDGKERLGFAMDAEERETLILAMLLETLAVLTGSELIRQVHVVSQDETLLDLAGRRGAMTIWQPRADGLNAGLRAGRDTAERSGARTVLFIPADLPVLSVEALGQLFDAADAAVAAGSGRPLVVIAPADVGGGTNALLLSPPAVIEPAFGQASLEAHIRMAAAADATVQLVTDPALGFDLDTPEDLERLDPARLLELLQIGTDALATAEPA